MQKTIFVIFTLILLIFSLSLLYVIRYEKVEIARAGTGDNLEGFAWSSNFGWVSFNCTSDDDCTPDYGVNINPDYNYQFSGYAWSSNVGWISFNERPLDEGFATHCDFPSICTTENSDGDPEYCSACLRTDLSPVADQYKVYGWAKVLALGDDGWIRLDDDDPSDEIDYGISIDPDSKEFSGFAWDSDLTGYNGIGWLSFNCNTPGAGGCASNYKVSAPRIKAPTPTGLTAIPTGCTSMFLDWDDPINNFDHFDVFRKNNSTWIDITAPGIAISEYEDFGLNPPDYPYGELIYYRVRSNNAFGPSEFAEVSGRTEPVCAPNFSITATTTGICPNIIRVAWGEVLNADYYALSRCHCTSVANCGECDLNIDPANSDNYKYVKTGDCYDTTGQCSVGECYCDDDTIPDVAPNDQTHDYFRYMISAVALDKPDFPSPFFGASSTPTYPPKQPCPDAPTWKEVK